MLDSGAEKCKRASKGKCSAESFFLNCLFYSLNNADIPYAVMRNYHQLPFSNGGSDLDILIKPGDEKRVEDLLFKSVEEANGVTLGKAKTSRFFKINVIGCTEKPGSVWWGQRIDVNVGFVYKGIPILDDSKWAQFTDLYNNIFIITEDLAGVLGVLKEVLNNGQIPTRYLTAAQKAAKQNWNAIEDVLNPMGKAALALLYDLILRPEKRKRTDRRYKALRTAIALHALRENLLKTGQQLIAPWASKISRYLYPPGKVVGFLGVDGAGKSTVINAILPALQAATHNAVFVQHLRPNLLPPLARLKGRKNVPTGPVLEPHKSKPSGKTGSLFRLFYLTLDYVLGYWLKTRPKIAKQPAVILYDRYAYDMALDPRRFRIGLSGRFVSWFASLAPKPDLIFCLHGAPETLAARKQELSVNETSRQIEALRSFATRETRTVLISTDSSIEETRDQVLKALCEFLSSRNRSAK